MKLFLLFALVAAPLAAQPHIGFVEIYGNRKVSKDKIQQVVGAKPGDPLPKSKGEVEDRLEGIGGILGARLEAYCCDEGKPILYVGVLERGHPAFEFRVVPGDDVTLPEEIVSAYSDFTAALNRAAANGDTKEDLSAGHSLMSDIACRVIQERFIGLAQLHEPKLRRVLNDAADPAQRAIAAYVIGYVPDKYTVVNDLQQALRDPDDAVRANATRSLKAISTLPAKAGQKAVLHSTWFVEMLNSVVLSDRIEGAQALLTAFDSTTDQTILQIRERALDSLYEMARWRHLPHALPAYLVLGKVAAIPDDEMQRSWARGERDDMLKRIEKALKK